MPEIQLQILSDLHLEAPAAYDMFEITPRATILALLGDIGQARDPGWIQFIERQLALFRIVLLVLGNHEPYYSSWEQVREQVRYFNEAREKQKQQGQGKLVLLDQGRYDVTDDFTILGCTLHSRIDAKHEERVSFGLNDFYYIENGWDVSKHSQAHKDDLAWLNGQVTSLAQEAPHRRIAILTHHSPCITANAMDPKNATSPIRSAFATDLSAEPCWTSKNVKLWAFGHTHFNCDFVDEGTGKHVLTNQRGYYFSQAAGFDAEKVVTIENSDMPGSVFKDTDATRVLSSPTTCSTHTNAFHNHVTMASQLPSQCLDNNLVAGITRILDEAGIPSVLWGNYLLSVFGVPTIVDDASFVIPDGLIATATSALKNAGFEDCSAYPTCPVVDVGFRCSPAPSAHVHLNQDVGILLFKKSETLWRLELPLSSPPEHESGGDMASKNIKLASDPCLPYYRPGRGKGAFSSTLYPVRIPSANRLLEAYTLLMIRDQGLIYERFWSAMLTYVRGYVEETGLIEEQELEPWCWSLYNAMFTGYVGGTLDELHKDKSLAPYK